MTTAKIANNNVTTAKIADGNVTTIKIANNNVTAAKIADGNVTTVKIADGNVTTAKLADGSVTTSKIANGNVTFAKLDPTGCAVGSVITRSGAGYICSPPASLPNCGEGQILRVVGGNWSCVNPLTLLPSCAADKVLVKDAGGNWVCGDPWYSNLCICIVGRGASDSPGGNQCRPINQWAEAWNSGDLRRISIMVKPAPCTNPPAKVHVDDD